jgi:hypothetical protein
MKTRLAPLAALGLTACATVPPPSPAVVEQARALRSYAADLRVGLRGPDLRGRASVIIGFVRPDGMRLEMPGPTGARFILVASAGRLTAVFPNAHAVFDGDGTADTLARITGVRLSAAGVMDLLVGVAPVDVRDYRAEWGDGLPRRVRATLSDETRIDIKVTRPERGREFPDQAFAPPPHEGYRSVTAEEARDLWLGR